MAKTPSRTIFRQLLPMTVLGVAASLALSAVVWLLERDAAETRFRELAAQRIIAVRANIAIALDSVNLLVGHFAVAPPGSTSRTGFAAIVARTVADHPFVQGFSWDPRVSLAQRPAFEERARRDGLEGFSFTERDAEGKTRPASSRDEYIPIYYMEPIASNLRALGFDLASHPVRRLALETARDQGRPEATGRITLVQEHGDQYGVLVLAPVFGPGGARDVDSNRRSLTGYISGVFRIGDLVDFLGVGRTAATVVPLVDIHLFDTSAATAEQRLYPKADARAAAEVTQGLAVSETFAVGGRTWLLVATPSEAFHAASRPLAGYAVLLVALVATVFYLSYLYGRIVQAEDATIFANEMAANRRRLAEAQRMAGLTSLDVDPAQASVDPGEGAAQVLGLADRGRRCSVEEVLGQIHDADRDKSRSLLLGETDAKVEFRLAGATPPRIIEASGESTAGGHRLITLLDVTARKAAEEERAGMLERLAVSDRFEALGTLAGGIAHEINTPTQYVGDNIVFMKEGIATLLDFVTGLGRTPGQTVPAELDIDFLAAELPAAADQAMDGIERIAKIVQAIKEFSYPSSKSPQPFNLNRMIDVVATVTRNQWKYVAEMEFDLDPHLPLISAVEGEINQVMVNLVVNAAQAIAEYGSDGPGKIMIRTRRQGDQVELSVADNGPGIAPEHQRQIFEMFFTTKAPGQGTGQGLAISRAIILRHGGQISVASDPGHGASFNIRLPLASPDGDDPTAPSHPGA